ncbi:DUF5996 family protein [Frankia sp. Cpl3]|nr:DUF5996 family protein [Frankia sp. Cpl3]
MDRVEMLPAIPLSAWAGTKETLHRYLQVIGKVRLAASQRRNHWWNVPLHLTGRGLTSRPMGQVDGNPIFTIDVDLVSHELDVHCIDGERVTFPLAGGSVASFYAHLMRALSDLGITVRLDHPHPFDLADSGRPFAKDTEHAAYDPVMALRYWQTLSQVFLLLEEFAAGFSGKVSPVHHFWHTFDMAHTRFRDRAVEPAPDTDPVTREAYSRELISSGFWFGDEMLPEPAFYSYTSPEPPGLAETRLHPSGARWMERGGSHLAVLPLSALTDDSAAQRRSAILAFLGDAYQAGAVLAGWDIDRYASPGGVTDPELLPARVTQGASGGAGPSR